MAAHLIRMGLRVKQEQSELLTAALRGDRDALAGLLMADSQRLAMRVEDRLRLNPFADFSTDDVLQEVFVDVFGGIKTFRPEDAAGWSEWLNKVADNRLATMLRERSRKKRGGEFRRVDNRADDFGNSVVQLVALLADDGGLTPSQNIARDELVHAVQVGIAALPEDQREAIQNYFIDQRNLDSTAGLMDKTDAAVRGLLHRAKKSLRDVLGNSTTWFIEKR